MTLGAPHLSARAGSSSVAARVGFASRSHFSRAFKSSTGAAPADYRDHANAA